MVAKKRVKYIQRILNAIGMESDRIAMVNLSSAMGAQFAQVATEMTERIRKLGPNPLRHSRQAGAPDVPDASE